VIDDFGQWCNEDDPSAATRCVHCSHRRQRSQKSILDSSRRQ
jgi:Zn ribbon nucleic-acid-binding protein